MAPDPSVLACSGHAWFLACRLLPSTCMTTSLPSCGVQNACLFNGVCHVLCVACRAVLRPLSCMGELVGEPGDSLVMTGLQLPSHPATGPAREALVGQIFLEFFRTVLYRLSHCCSRGRLLSTFSVAGDSLGSTPRLFRLTSRSTSSSINLLAAINAAAAMEQPGHGPSGPSVAVDKDRWIAYQTERRGLSPELHRQLVETVGLEQVAARVFSEGDPEGWYKQGLAALRECQEAEEKLLRTAGQVSAGKCHPSLPVCAAAWHQQHHCDRVQYCQMLCCMQSWPQPLCKPAQPGGKHVARHQHIRAPYA